MKIKEIIRSGVLETNSSSSHSVCICTDNQLEKPGGETWDLMFKKDGSLYVPFPKVPFETNRYKSNNCLLKIQYAYTLALIKDPTEQNRLTEIIKQVTGAAGVYLEWAEEYKREVKKNLGIIKDITVNLPTIDHQSVHLFYQIFESDDLLKNFIFNPRSWLFIDGDENDFACYEEIYDKREEDFELIASVDLGENIGNTDVIINPDPGESYISSLDKLIVDYRIMYLRLDHSTKELRFSDKMRARTRFHSSSLDPIIVTNEDEDRYFLAVFTNDISDYRLKDNVVNLRYVDGIPKITDVDKIIAGSDVTYRIFPITITSKIYGKLC